MVTQSKTIAALPNLEGLTPEQLRQLATQLFADKQKAEKEAQERKLGQISVKCPPREVSKDKQGNVLFEEDKKGQQKKDKTGKPIPKMDGGNIRIYGLGAFPVSLYASQAERLFDPRTVLMVLQQADQDFDNLVHKGDTDEERAAAKKKSRETLTEMLGIYAKVVEKLDKAEQAKQAPQAG